MASSSISSTQQQRRNQRQRQNTTMKKRSPSSRWRYVTLILLSCLVATASAWEWTDFLGGSDATLSFQSNTLSMDQVRDMRVRDIKRRLSRSHGYSADELGRILDKAELIQALSFEEHKEHLKHQEQLKRTLIIRGILFTIIAIVVVAGWPVWTHLYEVASVNLVVYMDKRKYEASRCVELKSFQGMLGVLLMAILDTMSMWLTVSVMLSWFTSSKYFFPTPNLPIRPAAMMGGEVARGPLASYGLNVGPMAISWAVRYANGQLEAFTGRALSKAYQRQKKEARQWETPEEKAARKAARRAAKKAAKEEAEQKKRDEEEAEAKRRKEAADEATKNLFGGVGVAAAATSAPTRDGSSEINDENGVDKGFREQMDSMDMDDLD